MGEERHGELEQRKGGRRHRWAAGAPGDAEASGAISPGIAVQRTASSSSLLMSGEPSLMDPSQPCVACLWAGGRLSLSTVRHLGVKHRS